MLIPLRTDRPPRRRPLVTELLILTNVAVFLLGLAGHYWGWFDLGKLIDFGKLDPRAFRPWQLLTSALLHDSTSIWHVGFNMLFLWVFGAPVEDRFGRLGFLAFYAGGAAISGLAHMMVNSAPAIGASGAVSAVVGAFLALFPRSRIQVFVFFFMIGIISVPSLWFIGLYFTIDVLNQTAELFGAQGDVAYMAHIAGYVYGFGLAFLLLATRLLKHEDFDIFHLFRQWRRRAAFRAAGRGAAGGLWESAAADTGRTLATKTTVGARTAPLTADALREAQARAEIARLVEDRNIPRAAARYADLLDIAPESVLTEPMQLDVGNQLFHGGDFARAAQTYELLLKHYRASRRVDEIRLILALMYVRHLHQPQRARELLDLARPRLRDPALVALLEELDAELRSGAPS